MTTKTTKRYIDIDQDTRVGFNYLKQRYYVTNKGYTTYRPSIPLIREVLNSLGITETQVDDEDLALFKANIEYLYEVSYTLQDNGAYIHTLQFNGFDEYPLTLDCEKSKLYIMNSTTIFDLTLNESAKTIRVPRIRAFYKDTLGLLISQADMLYFYNLLLSYYNPLPYNQIIKEEDTGTLYYNNKIILSNYSKTSPATYICTYNPDNNATPTILGDIIATNSNTNTILTSSIISNLQEGDKVIIRGTETEISGNTYTADGTYTVYSTNANTIQVAETIPTTYVFPYNTCYLQSATYTIESMTRSTRAIVIEENPQALLIGDTIIVEGAETQTEHETISCNGSYTIENILPIENSTSYTIIVEEEIPTDYTYTEGSTATLKKEIFMGSIASIETQVITLTNSIPSNLSNLDNSTIILYTNRGDRISSYTISSYTETTITVTEEIEDYAPTYPTLESPIPNKEVNTETLVNITEVREDLEEVFPVGEFMLDSYEQCQAYISTCEGLEVPTTENKENMYNRVEGSKEINTPDTHIQSMQFKGLYSQIYTEETQ